MRIHTHVGARVTVLQACRGPGGGVGKLGHVTIGRGCLCECPDTRLSKHACMCTQDGGSRFPFELAHGTTGGDGSLMLNVTFDDSIPTWRRKVPCHAHVGTPYLQVHMCVCVYFLRYSYSRIWCVLRRSRLPFR